MDEQSIMLPEEGAETEAKETGERPSVTAEDETAAEGAPVEGDGADGDEIDGQGAVDYASLAKRDLAALQALFPETRALGDLSEMKNAARFGELRDLGLSVEEAYRAVSAPVRPKGSASHLSRSGRRLSHAGASMPYGEMEAARALFPGLSSSDILSLYRRCTK